MSSPNKPSEVPPQPFQASSPRWSKVQIRSLRLRLGWSKAEFARKLSLGAADIDFLEQGLLIPNPTLSGELEIIMRQVESDSNEVRDSALVEYKVDDRL